MINWGILGAGNIAHRFANSLESDSNSALKAISARDKNKAVAFAKEYNVEKIFTHEELIKDPDIDAIYLALPHQLHKDFTIAALKAGKAVLCEKPATLNASEATEIKETVTQTGKLFMEAMKPRFVPAYLKVKELVNKGTIGDILEVKTSFCNKANLDKNTYHSDKIAGGALLDVGIYCASLLQDLLGSEFKVVETYIIKENGIDIYTYAVFDFNGKRGILETAFDREKPRSAEIVGTKGKIVIEDFHRPTKFTVITSTNKKEYIEEYKIDDFFSEIEHFNNLLIKGETESSIMSLADTFNTAKILESIKKFKKSDQI